MIGGTWRINEDVLRNETYVISSGKFDSSLVETFLVNP